MFYDEAYLVTGSSGEYDTYCEWTVCAYLDQQEAEKHAAAAQEFADRKLEQFKKDRSYIKLYEEKNPYDPHMNLCSSHGASYTVESLVVHLKFNEVAAN